MPFPSKPVNDKLLPCYFSDDLQIWMSLTSPILPGTIRCIFYYNQSMNMHAFICILSTYMYRVAKLLDVSSHKLEKQAMTFTARTKKAHALSIALRFKAHVPIGVSCNRLHQITWLTIEKRNLSIYVAYIGIVSRTQGQSRTNYFQFLDKALINIINRKRFFKIQISCF